MIKILYVASLNTKSSKYDGERIKSTLILDSLRKLFQKITIINLSKCKIFNTIKLIFICLFLKKQFKYFLISKDPRGGLIIEKIMKYSGVCQKRIIYFEIGPFLFDLLKNGKVKPSLFSNNRNIIVETDSMKTELESFELKNVVVFPNFKKSPSFLLRQKKYPVDILKIVYFSRIEEMKGIFELIDAVNFVNKDVVKYKLDIFGMFMSRSDFNRFDEMVKGNSDICYKGKLDMNDLTSYELISEYDLHVFPTHYDEGFPGTLIDFFFVGVPTLSSSFLRFNDILSTDNSFVYKQRNLKDLEKQLFYIHNNQELLSQKRIKTYELKDKYTTDSFDIFLEELLNE